MRNFESDGKGHGHLEREDKRKEGHIEIIQTHSTRNLFKITAREGEDMEDVPEKSWTPARE